MFESDDSEFIKRRKQRRARRDAEEALARKYPALADWLNANMAYIRNVGCVLWQGEQPDRPGVPRDALWYANIPKHLREAVPIVIAFEGVECNLAIMHSSKQQSAWRSRMKSGKHRPPHLDHPPVMTIKLQG